MFGIFSSARRIAELQAQVEALTQRLSKHEQDLDDVILAEVNRHAADLDWDQYARDALADVDFSDLAQDAVSEAIENATISVRF